MLIKLTIIRISLFINYFYLKKKLKLKKMSEETQEIKIILLGDTGVGKTNLIYAFLNSGFQDYPGSTLASYSFEGDYIYKNNSYKYNIWDTVGQEQYRSINKMFIRGSKIVLIVYSIDDRDSFNSVNFWINYVKKNLKGDKYIMGLIANKSDLYEENQMVMDEEGEEVAKKYGIDFLITSAKTSSKSFQDFVNKLIAIYIEKYFGSANDGEDIQTIKINNFKHKNNKNKTPKKKCC